MHFHVVVEGPHLGLGGWGAAGGMSGWESGSTIPNRKGLN